MSKVYGYGRLAFASEEGKVNKLKRIESYCQDNNLRVDQYFFDNGVSGLELNRKDLNALMDVLRGDDIIVVGGMADLSRNMFECMTVLNLIKSIGAKLIIIDINEGGFKNGKLM